MLWKCIVWLLPALTSIGFGLAVGAPGASVVLALAWIKFCTIQGTVRLGPEEFLVIEQFGKFKTVYFRGEHTLVIGVDRIRTRGTLRPMRFDIYARPDAPDMNFIDGTAPIDANVRCQIGNQLDISIGNWEQVAKDVQKWTYTHEDIEKHFLDLIDSYLRPRFRKEPLALAPIKKADLASDLTSEIESELKRFGMYPARGRETLIILLTTPDDTGP